MLPNDKNLAYLFEWENKYVAKWVESDNKKSHYIERNDPKYNYLNGKIIIRWVESRRV